MWTFGICTDGIKVEHHDNIVDSIQRLNMPRYEIVFCTENKEFTRSDSHVITVGCAKANWITRKKNEIARHAAYENLCLLHDYAALDNDWFRAFEDFGYFWDVCCMKILKPNGDRFMDWVTYNEDRRNGGLPYKELLPYDVQGVKNQMYVSGTAFCVKKTFLCSNPLNESLVWGQREDVEWAIRIRNSWRLELNARAIVRLLRPPSNR